uniref:hypothetical protein n=1 Tax=Gelidibacter sp. TaxID=2018083 RepID=UPI00404A79BE
MNNYPLYLASFLNSLKELQFTLIVVFYSTLISAQNGFPNQNASADLPTIISPAPTVAGLMRFEEVPIDAYSGQPNISIDLLSVPISSNMNYNLTLAYNTQGVRLDERSSWVGKGWSLISGGVISRSIKGLPDETNFLPGGRGVYHNNFENFSSFTLAQKEEFLWKTANGDEKYDSDYDLYQYNILGRTGRFIVEKDNNNLVPIILESANKDVINVSYNSTTYEITAFEVIDTSGYVFLFEVGNTNMITSHTFATPQYGSSTNSSSDTTSAQNVPNAWYLTEIRSPNGIVLCNFTYHSVNETYNTPRSKVINGLVGNVTFGAISVANLNKSMLMPKVIETSQSIGSTQKYVNTITFRDNSRIEFKLLPGNPELGCFDNNNCNNGTKLQYIEAYSSSNVLFKKYKFNYFITANNRLFLEQIEDLGGLNSSSSLSYDFEYNSPQNLPEFNSFKKDQWGYYNGNYNVNSVSNSQFITHSKQVNKSAIGTGLLTSITYPTGGKKLFSFEPQQFSYRGSQLYDVNKIPANRIFKNRFANLTASNINSESNPKVLLYIDTPQIILLENSIVSVGSEANLNNVFVKLSKVQPKSGVTITPPSNGIIDYSQYNANDFEKVTDEFAYFYDVPRIIDFTGVGAGWYFIELKVQPVELTPTGDDVVNVDVNIYYTFFSLISRAMLGGGVRIKDISFRDQEGNIQKKISYNYDDPNSTPALSSGSFEYYPESQTYTKWKTHAFLDGILCQENYQVNLRNPTNVRYEVTRDRNEVLTSNTKGNYVGYKYVTISETGNGKEQLEFVSPREIQIHNLATLQYPFPEPENKDYKRGNLKERLVFNEDNQILVKEEYNYRDIFNIMASSFLMFETQNYDCPYDQFYTTFDLYSDYQNYSINNPLSTCYPNINNVTETDGTSMTCFQAGTDMRFITYNHTSGLLLPEETIKTNYFYDDTNNQTSITSREEFTYNNYNFLVSVKKDYIEEAGVEKEYISEYFYSIGNTPSDYNQTIVNKLRDLNRINELLVTKTYIDNIQLSHSINEFFEFSTNQVLSSKVKIAKGNEVPEDRIQFYKYDIYGNPLDVSKTNGTRISYIWGYNNTYPVAKIENATYSEVESVLGVNFNLGNGGLTAAQVSNLRTNAILSKAMISTYTYDPLVGVTSMTDPKGYTMYYEYDEFNRLKQVKDAEGNILSKNEYKYATQN